MPASVTAPSSLGRYSRDRRMAPLESTLRLVGYGAHDCAPRPPGCGSTAHRCAVVSLFIEKIPVGAVLAPTRRSEPFWHRRYGRSLSGTDETFLGQLLPWDATLVAAVWRRLSLNSPLGGIRRTRLCAARPPGCGSLVAAVWRRLSINSPLGGIRRTRLCAAPTWMRISRGRRMAPLEYKLSAWWDSAHTIVRRTPTWMLLVVARSAT